MRRAVIAVLLATIFGTLAWLSLRKYEVTERLETHNIGDIQSENITQLWFSNNSELVGVGQQGLRLTVRVWSTPKGAILRERTINLPSPATARTPVFAVSSDASQAAWVGATGVQVANLLSPNTPKPIDLPFKRPVPIGSLAFTALGQIAALYSDGELELWNLAGDKVAASKHLQISDPSPLLASGPYLATYSLTSSEGVVFETGTGDKLSILEYKKYPSGILSATLSPKAQFATGTSEKLEETGASIHAPGPIQALSFVDRHRLFVGGAFEGIYLLSPSAGPVQVAHTDPGTSLLAATDSLLAFGTSRKISLVSHRFVLTRVYKGLSQPSPLLLIALFALISPFAIVLGYGVIKEWWRRWRRLRLSEAESKSALAEDDDRMPKALVDACKNGDCVLYAGAGLSAQAGLPVWKMCVQQLVEWAANNNLAPAAVTEPALAELARDQVGSAADRVAAALAAHGPALHSYLRERFRVATELSEAHRLIKEIDFTALITTNLDNLLDRTFPYSGGRIYTANGCAALARAAARRDFFLLKPFGDLEDMDSISIGPAQCTAVIEGSPEFSDFTEDLFNGRTLLFLGASIEGIEQDLKRITFSSPIEHKHFAFVPAIGDGWKAVAERLAEQYHIQVLTYSPSATTHPELVDFLNRLLEAMREAPAEEEYETAGQH